MVHQSFSTNDAFASMKRAVEHWETDSNVACLLSCYFLPPLSIVEDMSFVTLHHLRLTVFPFQFCSPSHILDTIQLLLCNTKSD
jgi:hypothetical protein